jgi:hypothetical protein
MLAVEPSWGSDGDPLSALRGSVEHRIAGLGRSFWSERAGAPMILPIIRVRYRRVTTLALGQWAVHLGAWRGKLGPWAISGWPLGVGIFPPMPPPGSHSGLGPHGFGCGPNQKKEKRGDQRALKSLGGKVKKRLFLFMAGGTPNVSTLSIDETVINL